MQSGKTLSFFTLLCLIIKPSLSQFPDTYIFQKDDTILRKQYLDESVKKRKLAIASTDQYATEYKKLYNEQFDEIEAFWKSSRPVTEPAVNEYLHQVAAKITQANDELKFIDARIIFSRDWWPNATSVGDGTIIVNAGLFIFLHNEAELAFILSHELAHYYLQHTQSAIKKYVETVNSKEYQEELRRLSKMEYGTNKKVEELIRSITFNSRRHNRDKEEEADRKAFAFMKNSGYDVMAMKTCLELLDKIDDSFYFNKPFDIEKFFSFKEYPFKTKWIKKESVIFSQLNDEDSPLSKSEKDSLKTHPDCIKRIALLTELFEKESNKGEVFLVDEQKFSQLKKDFYFEMMEQCYRDNLLSRNLFFSSALLNSHPANQVAVYSVVRNFNQLYDLQKKHKLGLSIDGENKVFPEQYNLLLRMIGKLRLEEITALNTQFCKKYNFLMKDYEGFEEELARLPQINGN